jgi:hypothetical protein
MDHQQQPARKRNSTTNVEGYDNRKRRRRARRSEIPPNVCLLLSVTMTIYYSVYFKVHGNDWREMNEITFVVPSTTARKRTMSRSQGSLIKDDVNIHFNLCYFLLFVV